MAELLTQHLKLNLPWLWKDAEKQTPKTPPTPFHNDKTTQDCHHLEIYWKKDTISGPALHKMAEVTCSDPLRSRVV